MYACQLFYYLLLRAIEAVVGPDINLDHVFNRVNVVS